MVYQGASGDVIKAIVDQGATGIVIASAGAGAISGTQGEGIRYAIDKGVFVVTSSRAGGGRIAARRPPSSATSRTDADTAAQETPQPAGRNRIAAEDLAPLKARILLMLALTVTKEDAEIQRMFVEY
jgi:L-asparaginase